MTTLIAGAVVLLSAGYLLALANCRARPWEPEKYPSREAQDQMLEFLLGWVREYETRSDEYSLVRPRRIFESFPGPKEEVRSTPTLVPAARD